MVNHKQSMLMLIVLVGVSFFSLAMPTTAEAAIFLRHCGGKRIVALSMKGACRRYPLKKLVQCRKVCTKRKMRIICVRKEWRQTSYKLCPAKPSKTCGNKTVTVTLRNTGGRSIFFHGGYIKAVGTIYLLKNKVTPPAPRYDTKTGKFLSTLVKPGETKTVNAKLSDRTGRRSDERSEKRRALAVRSNDLFAVHCSNIGPTCKSQEINVARFYIDQELGNTRLLLEKLCSTDHTSR